MKITWFSGRALISMASAVAVLLLPSTAPAQPAKVRQAEDKPVVMFQKGVPGRPSYLRTIKIRFDTPNAKIGELQKGWSCGPGEDLIWGSKLYATFSARLARAFRAELEKAGYPVPAPSDAIFDEPKDKPKSNDLHVGMLIKEISANLCANTDGTQGGVYMKVYWQVYAPEAQKVVYEATSEGSYQPEGAVKALPDVFFERAFAAAARNLLAEQGFHDTITGTPVQPAQATAQDLLRLKGAKAPVDPLAKNITTLRSAVVTITGETGTGSGFFVSQEGHLLTNRHVVGGARFVKVRLPTGRELVGEVLRSDKARDVALVKTEPIAVQPIAMRGSEPNIGEDVYALGSPLGDRFNTTLTRGILSGYRTIDDRRYLQSDVAILPGNSGGPLMDGKGAAVGITVAGLGARGLAGMNFFIPIGDALSKLGLQVD